MRRAVGQNVLRKEGAEKVTGRARYIDDLTFPGLLHARTIRSTIPAAGDRSAFDFDFVATASPSSTTTISPAGTSSR